MASVVAPPPVFQALAIRFVVKFVAVVRIRSLENIKRATKLGKVTVNKFHDLAEKSGGGWYQMSEYITPGGN